MFSTGFSVSTCRSRRHDSPQQERRRAASYLAARLDMHEATVRAPAQKSHQVAPVRVRQSDPVVEAGALVAREDARGAA